MPGEGDGPPATDRVKQGGGGGAHRCASGLNVSMGQHSSVGKRASRVSEVLVSKGKGEEPDIGVCY